MKRLIGVGYNIGHYIDKFNAWVAKVMAIFVLLLLVVTMYGVIMRYVFHMPPQWGSQVLLLLFVPVAALSGGYVLSTRGHVNVDLLYSRWSPRVQALIQVTTFALFLLFTVILTMEAIKMAWASVETGEVYSQYIFRGPVYPKKIAMAIGVILLLLQGIVEFVRNVKIVVKGRV